MTFSILDSDKEIFYFIVENFTCYIVFFWFSYSSYNYYID